NTSDSDLERRRGPLSTPGRAGAGVPTPPSVLSTLPPLGRAGLSDAEIVGGGRPALVAKRAMTNVKRAVEKGETQGFMKIVVDAKTGEILGAAILGPGGDEVIHSILDVMYAKAPYSLIRRAMHIHPTVSELIPTMLDDLHPLAAATTPGGDGRSAQSHARSPWLASPRPAAPPSSPSPSWRSWSPCASG